MTTYRVGAEGATVFAEDGTPIYRLRPGQVVVAGVADSAEPRDTDHVELISKRIRGYANKRIVPSEDKA